MTRYCLLIAFALTVAFSSGVSAGNLPDGRAEQGLELLTALRHYLLDPEKTMELDLHILAEMDHKIELFNDRATLTMQGDHYRLDGAHFVFYADAAYVWLYDPYAEELTVSDRVVDYTNFLENPLAILQEDALAHFQVSAPRAATYEGEPVQILLLSSLDVQDAWVIEVAIGPEQNRLRYLNCARDRENYQIQVLGIRQRPAVETSFFTPDPVLQDAVELVDLR